MTFGTGPREVARQYRLAESSVAFGEIVIELDCRRSRFVSRRGTFGKRHHAEHAEPVVIVRYSGVRERVLRIERDRLLVTNNRARETFLSKRVPVETSAQVSFVRLRIVSAAFGQTDALVNGEVRHDRLGNVRRNDVFEIQNIGKLFVKLSGPRSHYVADVWELNRNANASAGASDAAAEHEGHAELDGRI